jgi:cytochrome c oxidase subunit 4
MSDHDTIDIAKHVRAYMLVFGTLVVLTVVTVGVSYLHLSMPVAIVLALMIATVKAGLVASYFMHLISERRLIYSILWLTVGLFAALLLLPMLTSIADQVSTR